MRVSTSTDSNSYTVWLEGDLDASSAILLDESIRQALEQQPDWLWIDCDQLVYISSAGIGVFVSYLEDIERQNTRLALIHVNPVVQNVFRMLGLDDLVPVATSREEAIRFYSRGKLLCP